MEKEQLFKIGLRIGDGCIDYPFENDFETAVFRRKDNRKWFGIYLGVPKKYFGERDLKAILQNLRDLDYHYKVGLIDLQIGLESILCRYCS